MSLKKYSDRNTPEEEYNFSTLHSEKIIFESDDASTKNVNTLVCRGINKEKNILYREVPNGVRNKNIKNEFKNNPYFSNFEETKLKQNSVPPTLRSEEFINLPSRAKVNWGSSTLRSEESLNFDSTSFPQNSFSPTLRSGEIISFGRSNEKTNKYCNNCGKQGHLYSHCKVPITSYGVIAFRYNPILKENEYLMVCRQNSFGFIDFMRGKYSIYNKHYINNMVAQMTVQEKKDLVTMEFDDLWRKLWDLPPQTKTSANLMYLPIASHFDSTSFPQNSFSPTLRSEESLNLPQKATVNKFSSTLRPEESIKAIKSRKNEEMTSKEKFNALRKGVYIYPSYSNMENFRDLRYSSEQNVEEDRFSALLSEKLKDSIILRSDEYIKFANKNYQNESLNLPSQATVKWSSSTLSSEESLNNSNTVFASNLFPKNSSFYSLYSIIDEYVLGEQWVEPEWGFPKGRRNYQEKDYDAAIREFKEETGYEPKYLKNIQNIFPFEENLVGSNYKSYKHKYYLMSIEYNDSLREDGYSNSEISSVKWKTYQQCIDSIRSYNIEKKKLILNIHQCLCNYGLYY